MHALAWSSRAQCWCRDGLSLFFCFQVAVWNHMSAHLARGRHAHVARAGRHVCPTCFYRAPAASALDMHMRIHKYVRCQGSAYCGRVWTVRTQAFICSHPLWLWFSVCSGSRPYHCTLCDYSAATHGAVIQHLQTRAHQDDLRLPKRAVV